MSVHFWDMDHTIIDNDCDVSWKEFLIESNFAPPTARAAIEFFWDQYENGSLDVEEFFHFQLAEFVGKTTSELKRLAEIHFQKKVKSRIYPKALSMIKQSLEYENQLCMITSTNRIIAEPVAANLGFKHLLATELEIQNDRFTGKISGEYCGGKGKIPRILNFCHEFNEDVSRCYYFGDSINDIPVFEFIGHPVVVNPSKKLSKIASQKDWEIIKFGFS